MAYSDLSNAEMVEISHLWVGEPTVLPNGETAPTYRQKILNDAVIGGMLKNVEGVHNRLLTYTKKEDDPTPPTPDPSTPAPPTPTLSIKELIKRQRGYDKRHDELVRGLDEFLKGLAALCRDPALKKRILTLRDHLLPLGRKTANLSFSEEAGAARQLEGRLTEDDKNLLKTIVLKFESLLDTDLLDFVLELIGLGKQIGALEEKKQELRKAVGAAPQDEPSEKQLRSEWIEVVEAFERVVYLSNLSKEDQEAILSTLYRLEKRAAEQAREEARRRQAEKKAQEQKQQPQEQKEDKLLPPGSTKDNT